MMEFPLKYHLDSIQRIGEIIPKDRFITKDEILNMSDNDINHLKIYFGYTYSLDYQCLSSILQIAEKAFMAMQNSDVILAPGDSPSKIIYIIYALWGLGNNNFLRGNEIINLRFLQFPLSGLGDKYRDVDLSLLDSYLKQILNKNNISSSDNIVFLDYIAGGGTYAKILASLKRITNNNNFNLKRIDLWDIIHKSPIKRCILEDEFTIAHSEHTNSRCIPQYKLGITELPVVINNILRCNVVLAMLVLLAFNKLGSMPKISKAPSLKGYEDSVSYITYLDPPTDSVKRELLYILGVDIPADYEGGTLGLEVSPISSFDIIRIPNEYLIEVQKIPINQPLKGEHPELEGKYLRVRLANNDILEGQYLYGSIINDQTGRFVRAKTVVEYEII